MAFKRRVLDLEFSIHNLVPAKRIKKTAHTGDEITVRANEAVEWSVSGAEVKILETGTAYIRFKVLTKSGTVKVGAKGRCDTKSISFNITSLPIVLKSETAAMLPTNRGRTTIGVGEAVKVWVTSAEPVTWRISGASAKIIEHKDKEMTFAASDVVGTVTVTAKSPSDEQSLDFQVIAPSGIYYYEDEKTKYIHETFAKPQSNATALGVSTKMAISTQTLPIYTH